MRCIVYLVVKKLVMLVQLAGYFHDFFFRDFLVASVGRKTGGTN